MSIGNRVDKDVVTAAREMAGNWKSFESFGWGGRPDDNQVADECAIVYLSDRDSDCLDQSNEAQIIDALRPWTGAIDDGDDVETQSHNHWAVGHVDGIVIRCLRNGEPTAAFRELHGLLMRLADYPVLDEMDYSERENEEAQRVWSDCYNDRERIAYMRRNSSQFSFSSFSDMLGCARGKYFAGYASELIAP